MRGMRKKVGMALALLLAVLAIGGSMAFAAGGTSNVRIPVFPDDVQVEVGQPLIAQVSWTKLIKPGKIYPVTIRWTLVPVALAGSTACNAVFIFIRK